MGEDARFFLDEIRTEFLKYAPAYAQAEAAQAIEKIRELQMQGLIRNGLFYITLVDLVGSTKYAAEYGNQKSSDRIQYFVTSSLNALIDAEVTNIALFVKEIGDAVLFIFQHFPDILRWRTAFADRLDILRKFGGVPFEIRTCVHLGEVFLDGVNPLSLAVSQCFKMEKKVTAGSIVLTEGAYQVAWPTIARAYHGFRDFGDVELDGFKSPVSLHELILGEPGELKRIVQEDLE